MVTASGDDGRYGKSKLSLLHDIDTTLCQIDTDLKTYKFGEILFFGVQLNAHSAMGMPSSEPALEEPMCFVLDDLIP